MVSVAVYRGRRHASSKKAAAPAPGTRAGDPAGALMLEIIDCYVMESLRFAGCLSKFGGRLTHRLHARPARTRLSLSNFKWAPQGIGLDKVAGTKISTVPEKIDSAATKQIETNIEKQFNISGGQFQGCAFGDENSVQNFAQAVRQTSIEEDAKAALTEARQAVEDLEAPDEDKALVAEDLTVLTKELAAVTRKPGRSVRVRFPPPPPNQPKTTWGNIACHFCYTPLRISSLYSPHSAL